MKSLTAFCLLAFLFQFTTQAQYSVREKHLPEKVQTVENDTLYLPFFEDWSSVSFEENGWKTDSDVWQIDEHQGNPAPSLQHIGTETLSLYSAYFDATNLDQGKIWLEFNIKLEADSTDGWSDFIDVSINESGNFWPTIIRFRSGNGGFDWDTVRVNITEIAKRSAFRIMFNTYHYDGNDTTIQWNIDNVHIYRECDPPKNFTVAIDTTDYDQYQLNFNWEMDPVLQGKKLHWDNDKNYSGIGAGVNVTGAIRWDSNQLIEYDGDTIFGMRAFILDDDFEKLVFRIWEGADANQQIYHDTIPDFQAESWIEHFVDTTLVIDAAKEYWVGYTVFNTAAGTFPLGTDKGPAVKNYGDLVSDRTDYPFNWDPLSDYGLEYNWNIQLILKESGEVSEGLTAYNLYKQKNNGNNELISTIPWGTNSFSLPFEANSSTWCYQLTSQWESETDFCESEPANTLEEPIDNKICIQLVDDFENIETEQNISIFPNPANNLLHLKAEVEMSNIRLINNLGNVILNEQTNRKEYNADVSQLSPGIYFLQIETEIGLVNKKIVVNH